MHRFYPGQRMSLLLLTALALLASGPARSQEPRPSRSDFPGKWERVLMLDALRYLRLSPEQLQQLLPLARTAQERLASVQAEQDGLFARLEPLLDQHRQALLEGRRPPAREEAGAVREGRQHRARGDQAEAKLVEELAPKLGEILSAEQFGRAYLLAQGEWPSEEARSPALLDRSSGFVLVERERDEQQAAGLRRVLARRYPSDLVDGLLPNRVSRSLVKLNQNIAQLEIDGLIVAEVQSRASEATARLYREQMEQVFVSRAIRQPDLSRFPPAQVQAARFELDGLKARPERLAASWVAGAKVEELLELLRPLARRLFLSPQFEPALVERVRRAGIEVERSVPGG